MSYVEENLMPGEEVVYEARLHWTVYSLAMVLALLGLVILLAGGGWGVLVLLLGGLAALAAYVTSKTSEFAVTDKRVLIKVGWIQRRSLETLLNKVEGIGVEQGLGGRLFGYGTIVVTGTGGTPQRFKNIDNPLEFRRRVQAQITVPPIRAEARIPAAAPSTGAGREERECPYCAELILAKARVCKHCGRDVQPLV